MDNAKLRNLGDYAISAAVTNYVITSQPDEDGATQPYIETLDGMLAATLQINFVPGTGGTSVRVMVETSIDQGTTWIEVWRALFGTTAELNAINLSGLTPRGSVTPAALADDAVNDGLFGQRWRAKVTSVGVYAGNASVSVRLNPR